MILNDLRKKNISELKLHLLSLYKKKFKLFLEKTSGADFIKNHILKKCKKDIARTLTLINEKKNEKKT